MTARKLLAGTLLLVSVYLAAGTVEKKEAGRYLALCGGRLVTVSGPEYETGTLLIRGGKIAAIDKDVPLPDGVQRIDITGCTVVPGFIDAFTNLGTVEIPSASQDFDEASAPLTPQLRIVDSINPANRFIREARRSGVTTALCAPGDGNLLTGRSALIRLSGKTVDAMTIEFPAGLHGTLGEGPKMRYGQKGTYPFTRMAEVALLRQTFLAAGQRAEERKRREGRLTARQGGDRATAVESLPQDPKLDALIPTLEGRVPLILSANRQDDILSALRLAEEFGLRVILNHAVEAYELADRLSQRSIPVLLGPLTDTGTRQEEFGFSRENVLRLSQAGVLFAFQTGSYNRSATLRDQAGEAMAHGLSAAEALKALTLYPARIFGVDDRLGSLETGKLADVVVFDGSPLERASKVRLVIINGEIVEDMRVPAPRTGEERGE
jgi:imidazolonepropionase-like amidohydrolase